MHGYEKVEWSDHQFAKWLAKHDIAASFRSVGNVVCWPSDGAAQAVVFYENEDCSRVIWVRS